MDDYLQRVLIAEASGWSKELNSVDGYVDVDEDLLEALGKAIRELKKIRKKL